MSWEIKKRFNDFEVSRQTSKQTTMAKAISKMETTAVEWLIQQVNSDCLNSTFINPQLIEQAKEMEKEQIIDAATWGYLADTGEQYYKEKYKQ